MRTKKFFWLVISLFLLVTPALQMSALATEVEIELLEVSSILPGDSPLDSPVQGGDVPPQPNDFSATITGGTLAISSGTHSAQVIVRNSAGAQVLNRQFVGGTVEQIASPGSYSLEIQSGSLTLVGFFEAE